MVQGDLWGADDDAAGGARFPMPDYMAEQIPGLMPHMIGDVVPLVTQPMIDYLEGKRA